MSKKEDKKQSTVQCLACGTELAADHIGIHCNQNHHLCGECGSTWLTTIMGEGLHTFPPSCPMCKSELSVAVVERNISNDAHRQLFMQKLIPYTVQKQEGDVWISCPNCVWQELRNVREPPMFIFCCNATCGIRTCYTCKRTVTDAAVDSFQDDDEEDSGEELTRHFICAELAAVKADFDGATEAGRQQCCPSCSLAGVKDDNCTHMTCPRCNTEWCYLCGKALKDLDKAPGEATISGHNIDWWRQPNRCPMYLSQIHDCDPGWPVADDQCVNYFHTMKTKKLLKVEFARHGLPLVERLLQQFPGILSGFTIADIDTIDAAAPPYCLNDELELDE